MLDMIFVNFVIWLDLFLTFIKKKVRSMLDT
jgi:hypothetical protein